MSSAFPEHDKLRHQRWQWLLILLALLMSFACIAVSTGLAVSRPPDRLSSAALLATGQADYGASPRENTRFAPLDPNVMAQAATDTAGLHATPSYPVSVT